MVPSILRAIKKAQSSSCREKVSAIGLDMRGNAIAFSRNTPRFVRKGGSVHAEMCLMKKFGQKIKTIIICRTNKSGHLLPIDPCEACARKAEKLGIKITTIQEYI